MPNLILLFNHTITTAQEADARHSLGINDIIEPPLPVQSLWAQVPPESNEITEYLAPILEWLAEIARQGDYLLVQGEFGATRLGVNEAFRLGIIPIYSTTRREVVEKHLPNGGVAVRHIFSHVRYRRYEK